MTNAKHLEEIREAAYSRYIGWLLSSLTLAFAVAGGLVGATELGYPLLTIMGIITVLGGVMSIRTFFLYRKAHDEWGDTFLAELGKGRES